MVNPEKGQNMKTKVLLAAFLSTAAVASGTLYTTNWSSGFANGGVIPDNNFSGWLDTRTVNAVGTINAVSVTLDLGSGWNGDLYAYLVHGSGFAVLLDRVGYAGIGFGYDDSGFAVTLTTSGNPVESYQNYAPTFNLAGQLTGIWQAHGGLSSLVGLDANGTWSLFLADMSAGGATTCQGWGLQMDIVAVPEVEPWVAAALAGAFGAFWVNRQIWGPRPG
jgi:subtilisin-like proprotein convertase family protein